MWDSKVGKKQAFCFDDSKDEEAVLDEEVENIREGLATVKFSQEFKRQIRTPWSKALIVKVYGRMVGFNFIHNRLLALWKLARGLDCEPDFRPATASVTSVAVWVRLNKLPIEYNNSKALLLIEKSIGNVLRVDTHTTTEARGRFARLCVQIDVEKPLIMALLIGKFEQRVCYEGVQKFCFSCGRICHRKESCPYIVLPGSAAREERSVVDGAVGGHLCDEHAFEQTGDREGPSSDVHESVHDKE
ncbi:uncharacterized protein LOC142635270 [Castanea sativa]|uniref:uncharacterized protein LOC142635270 n=1 Tax=Castanea sativa TaxID=21020 RepID=UPI003F651647